MKLVKEPASVPIVNKELSYKRQNEIIKKSMFLYSAFNGLKISNLGNKEKPAILKGSVIEFAGSLFYAENNIEIEETSTEECTRYIALILINNGLELKAVFENVLSCEYNMELLGFYKTNEEKNEIKKYITLKMKYYKGEYVAKNHFKEFEYGRV